MIGAFKVQSIGKNVINYTNTQYQDSSTGAGIGSAGKMVVDSNDNIITINSSKGIASYSSTGTRNWGYVFNNTIANTAFQWVTVDSANNIYIGGSSHASIYPALIKLNSSGVHQWTKILTGTSNTSMYSVVIDSADNIYCMSRPTVPTGATYFSIHKYDTSGNLLLQYKYTFTSSSSLTIYSMKIVNTNLLVAGQYNTTGTFRSMICLIPNTLSSIYWAKSIPGFAYQYSLEIIGTTAFLITTGTNSSAGTQYKLVSIDCSSSTFTVINQYLTSVVSTTYYVGMSLTTDGTNLYMIYFSTSGLASLYIVTLDTSFNILNQVTTTSITANSNLTNVFFKNGFFYSEFGISGGFAKMKMPIVAGNYGFFYGFTTQRPIIFTNSSVSLSSTTGLLTTITGTASNASMPTASNLTNTVTTTNFANNISYGGII